MQEALLHHIWKFKLFSIEDLKTTDSEQLTLISTGTHNHDSGPDFNNGKVKIEGITWAGNIEIHIKSSDWYAHKHETDPAYENVVLHVVWEHDKEVIRSDGKKIPTLELKNRVKENIINNYQNLVNTKDKIPCESAIGTVSNLTILSMLDKTLMSRVERKAEEILELFHYSDKNWEETTFRLLAKSYGFKINSEPLFQTIKGIPLSIVQKHADNLLQIEALFFGQAGFLDQTFDHNYYTTLLREYSFLSHKYELQSTKIEKHQWKFMRLRPANFPTIRLAQFAALMHNENHLFSRFLYTKNADDLKKLLKVKQSDFWQNHYTFEKQTEQNVPGLGSNSIDNLIINTICPLLVAYSKYKNEQMYTDKAIHFLESTKAEHNHIIKYWKGLGLEIKTAFDSQAIIELNNNYCKEKKCLSCNIGVQLLRK